MSLYYRTVWISDIHLGSKGCKAHLLLEFLEHVECEHLYLVGDIFDIVKLKSGLYWPAAHNHIVRLILDKAQQGTQVIYIPGNHDQVFRQYDGMNFNGVEVKINTIHQTQDGRKLLILHGDEFDALVCANRNLAYFSGVIYELLIVVNRWFNDLRTLLGYPYWSLSQFLKYKVKKAVVYINNFRHIVSHEASNHNVDGVICGHIHHADHMTLTDNKSYSNCGDWVESCTALVEDQQGQIQLISWLEQRETLLKQSRQVADISKAA